MKHNTVNEWVALYLTELDESDYADSTKKMRRHHSQKIIQAFGDRRIDEIKAYEIEDFLNMFIAMGTPTIAREAHSIFNELYRKALMYESVKNNIMGLIKSYNSPPIRNRLTLKEWLKIYDDAKKNAPPYLKYAMLLALVAGMRIGDIVKARKGDVWDNHLHIVLDKDKNIAKRENRDCRRIALPIDLHCNAIGVSIRDIIEMSPYPRYIIYHKRLSTVTPSNRFREARDRVYPRERWRSPPSFHEQRSLAERLYAEQGVKTKDLLGHLSNYTTDKYGDARGREYKKLII